MTSKKKVSQNGHQAKPWCQRATTAKDDIKFSSWHQRARIWGNSGHRIPQIGQLKTGKRLEIFFTAGTKLDFQRRFSQKVCEWFRAALLQDNNLFCVNSMELCVLIAWGKNLLNLGQKENRPPARTIVGSYIQILYMQICTWNNFICLDIFPQDSHFYFGYVLLLLSFLWANGLLYGIMLCADVHQSKMPHLKTLQKGNKICCLVSRIV